MSDAEILSKTRALLDTIHEAPSEEIYDSLIEVLRYHEHRYYVLDSPLLSDKEYDQLYKRLEQLEQAFPTLIIATSPTQRVGSDLTADLAPVDHIVPMLSLANSYNLEDLQEWEGSVRRYLNLSPEETLHYAVEPKYDGGSVALVYEDNCITRGATRGNGAQGEEITANVKSLPTVPLEADFAAYGIRHVELRGEALIRKDRFSAINEKRQAAGLDVFANPRNAATGALRMKDPSETAARRLDLFVYSLGYGVDNNKNDQVQALGSHFETVSTLANLGFLTPGEHMKRCSTIEEVAAFCQEMETKRPNLLYELDGMVVKVDSLAYQDRLGNTSHHPRWAIAYKFAAQQATSKLLSVDYQVGKIGSITPVARIQPVALAGVTVSNVSLHNEDFIRDKDIRIGDQLLVERAGDVIPYIVKSLPEYRDGTQNPVEWPTTCPECNTPIVRPEGEARWLCVNNDCPAQVMARLVYHVSKNAMDIDGLGEKQLAKFWDLGFIKEISDIYRLPYDQILSLEGFKERSIENLKTSIQAAKQNPIQRLLVSLSIHHVGRKASRLLAEQVTDIRDLGDWSEDQFKAIHGMGQTVADNVRSWFAVDQNRAMLDTLAQLGVNTKQTDEDKPKAVNTEGVFAGKTILFTGKLEVIGRKEAQAKAEAAGARNVSGVSAKLDILVVGEKAGSKLKKAQAIGTVKILTEAEFLALIP